MRTTLPADDRLVEALRDGDEASFGLLVEQYHGPMVRMARMYVPSREVAEDVVRRRLGGSKGSALRLPG